MAKKNVKNLMVYSVFPTALGWCGLVKGGAGIVRVFLPETRKASAEQNIRCRFPGARRTQQPWAAEQRAFEDYFKGQKVRFPCRLDFSRVTPFQQAVLREVGRIPYGQVRTYGWVARSIGRPHAARAVGTALGRNPFPVVIPCHRVIRKSGRLGGFSGPGGTALKAQLLYLEGNNRGVQGQGIRYKGQGIRED